MLFDLATPCKFLRHIQGHWEGGSGKASLLIEDQGRDKAMLLCRADDSLNMFSSIPSLSYGKASTHLSRMRLLFNLEPLTGAAILQSY